MTDKQAAIEAIKNMVHGGSWPSRLSPHIKTILAALQSKPVDLRIKAGLRGALRVAEKENLTTEELKQLLRSILND